MEEFYQYCWKYKLYATPSHLVDGASLEVLNPGMLNEGAGPDFSCARVVMAGREWAGDVEVHVRASDWHRHGHDGDPAYDKVVLHVVAVDDTRITVSGGRELPQFEVLVPRELHISYARLHTELHGVRCREDLKRLYPIEVTDWLERLGIERLQEKSSHICEVCDSLDGDWEHTMLAVLARALGGHLNGEPLELLARSITLNTLGRHSDNLQQIEALMFGQAGLLDPSTNIHDAYYQFLCREYYFLAKKYGLRPLNPAIWKFARTRPQNFPHRRIAQLCRLLEGGFSLMRMIIEKRRDIDYLEELFDIEPSEYWQTRYTFGAESRTTAMSMSRSTIHLILINAVAPFLYAYGSSHANWDIADEAVRMLDLLPAENNSIIREWKAVGIGADSAFRSQALLQMRRKYCDAGNCSGCRLGYYILKRYSDKPLTP